MVDFLTWPWYKRGRAVQQKQMKLQPVIKTIRMQATVIQSLRGIRLRDIVGYSVASDLANAVVDLECQAGLRGDCVYSLILSLAEGLSKPCTKVLTRRKALRWPGIKSGSMSWLLPGKKGAPFQITEHLFCIYSVLVTDSNQSSLLQCERGVHRRML